jgi:hypothetical protein
MISTYKAGTIAVPASSTRAVGLGEVIDHAKVALVLLASAALAIGGGLLAPAFPYEQAGVVAELALWAACAGPRDPATVLQAFAVAAPTQGDRAGREGLDAIAWLTRQARLLAASARGPAPSSAPPATAASPAVAPSSPPSIRPTLRAADTSPPRKPGAAPAVNLKALMGDFEAWRLEELRRREMFDRAVELIEGRSGTADPTGAMAAITEWLDASTRGGEHAIGLHDHLYALNAAFGQIRGHVARLLGRRAQAGMAALAELQAHPDRIALRPEPERIVLEAPVAADAVKLEVVTGFLEQDLGDLDLPVVEPNLVAVPSPPAVPAGGGS